MDTEQFKAELMRDGFSEAIAGEYRPSLVNPDHTHPFEVRGLVLAGEMQITGGGKVQHCRAGEVFVMRLGEIHREDVGAEGVRYLYGSREAGA